MWIKDQEIEKVENEIVQYAKKYEPTTYYHRESCSLYIFSERLSFSIKKHPEENKYGARFVRSIEARGRLGKGYIHTKNLEEMKNKLKDKVDDYYKQRLRLAVQGKTYDMKPKLLHAIYEKQPRGNIEIRSEIGPLELNKKIRDAFIKFQLEEVKDEIFEHYLGRLKEQKQRKKPKRAIKCHDLYIFVYDKRIDIVKSETIEAI